MKSHSSKKRQKSTDPAKNAKPSPDRKTYRYECKNPPTHTDKIGGIIPFMKHVLIIGSGLIGLSTAFALKQRGVPEITIIDSAPGPHGASVVNAGWVTPTHSDPVGVPGMTKQVAKWMLKSDSPLYIKPALHDPEFMWWLFKFWRACNDKSFNHATAAMVALNEKTFPLFDSLTEAGVKFEMYSEGLIMAFLSGHNLEAGLKHLERYLQFGFPTPKVYWGQDARELEPALSANVNGVFHIEAERHLRPDTLTKGLVDWLDERGVNFANNSTVVGMDISGGAVRAVEATGGRYEADAVVIAAGAYSGRLAKMSGKGLPVQAGKGYKIDYHNPPTCLRHPMSLHEPRMAVTPMGTFTRFAGTMELSGINTVVRKERVAALARGGQQFLRDWPSEIPQATVDSGMRPMTPDGMPIIGAMPNVRNLTISTGHQMLGLGLAPASGDALAELIVTGKTPPVLEPFGPNRF
jgi:D-amino-acid dehydrogenase